MFPWLPWVWKGVGGEYISPCGPLLVLSRLSCPSCLRACIEVFLAWRPRFAPPRKEIPLCCSPLGESTGLVQSGPKPYGRRQWDTLRSPSCLPTLLRPEVKCS